jgi:hypothetical protein
MGGDFSEGSKAPGRRESSRVGVTSNEMPSTSQSGVNADGGSGVIHELGGALFQPSDAQATERMNGFLSRRNSKDALMALRRALQVSLG